MTVDPGRRPSRSHQTRATVKGVKRKELTTGDIILIVEVICLAGALFMPITPARGGRSMGELAGLLVVESDDLPTPYLAD